MDVKEHDFIDMIREDKFSTEDKVNMLLTQCCINKAPPINVWEVARKLGFTVVEGEFKDNNLTGVMIGRSKELNEVCTKRLIMLNKDCKSEQQAFMIAHCIAHFILHCKEKSEFFEAYSYSRTEKHDKVECEADTFAMELLMPRELIASYSKRAINIGIRDVSDVLAKMFFSRG